MEEDLMKCQTRFLAAENLNVTMADKLDDLDNRSRRNNLRLVVLPESIKATNLAKICKRDIPRALPMDKKCEIERVHQTGNPQSDRRGPRQVIVNYSHYGD